MYFVCLFFQNYTREWFHVRRLQTIQARGVQQYSPIAGCHIKSNAKSWNWIRHQRTGGKKSKYFSLNEFHYIR